MSHYSKRIAALLHCNSDEAIIIEDLMRMEVFHSTLDWQTRQQFDAGARAALRIFLDDREFFNGTYAQRRAAFQSMAAAQNANDECVAYEI